MNTHRYYKIVKKNRLHRRKCGSGQPKMLDDVNERFVLEYIDKQMNMMMKCMQEENHHDAVMYAGRMVENRDFLTLLIMGGGRILSPPSFPVDFCVPIFFEKTLMPSFCDF